MGKRGRGESEDVVLTDNEVTEDVLPPWEAPPPAELPPPAQYKMTDLERKIIARADRVTVESYLAEMEAFCASGGSVGLNEIRALKRIASLV